jgi:hypothetical protein
MFLVGRGWDGDCRTAEADAAFGHPHNSEHLRRRGDRWDGASPLKGRAGYSKAVLTGSDLL